MKHPTDARRFYVLMRDAGIKGIHSHELRRAGVSGNPSQRAKDIVSKGVAVSTQREPVGKRPGSRYWLADLAPPEAVAVRPNGADLGGSPAPAPPMPGVGTDPPAAEMSAEQLSWRRDFTDPAGEWRLVPAPWVSA